MATNALVFPDYSNLPYVNTYADLPAASLWTNRFVVVLNSQGTWWLPGTLGGTFYNAGLYFSNGVTWDYTTDVPFEATLTEVNTGTVTDKFVSPYTLANANKWNDYVLKTTEITINGVTQDLSANRSWTISNSPAGSDKEIQFNNSGSFGSATNVTIQDEELAFPSVSNPTTPTAAVKLYGKKLLNRFLLAFKDTNGFENFVQPSLFTENVQIYKAAGSVNQMTVIGGVALTATGTATGSTIATTNIYTQSKLVEYLQTTASTAAIAGFRTNNAQFFRGASSSQGGFFFVGRWGPATGVATATKRATFGMHGDQAGPTDVNPSTILNQLAMGWDNGDTNIQIMSNSGTGTATKKDLGASFPVPTAVRTKLYELGLYCAPGATLIYYYVLDVGTGAVAIGTIDTTIDKVPSATQLLGLKCYMSVGGTSSVIGVAFHGAYIGTNY